MKEKSFTKFLRNQVIIIGTLFAGDQIFGFFEQNYLNTYLDQVLGLTPLFISLMVSLSAIVGLIMNITWGIISDNTRSKYGRRRPFLLFGIIAGISMILFAFSIDFAGGNIMTAYIICIVLDVIIIGITSNAYYVCERSLIPDTVDLEKRGRANGIINIIGYIGLLIAIAAFLVSDLIFGQETPEGTVIGQMGHIFTLSIGGLSFLITGLIGFFFIKEKPISELPPKRKFLVELKEIINIEQFKANKEFFKIVLALTIFRTGISTIMPFLFIWIFALGLSTVELLVAVLVGFVILFLITSLLGKLADKHGRRKFIPISIVIISIGIILAPLVKIGNATNYPLVVFILPFMLIAVLGLATPMNAWSQDLIPEDKRGKFFGILNIIFTISQIIGSIVGGLVATYFLIAGLVPESFVFVFAPIFFLGSIPLFLRVKETLVKE
jgi:Na+/melibiose symporter-like transporter